MGNDILSQVLGSALGGAGRGTGAGSPLGGLLGELLGRSQSSSPTGRGQGAGDLAGMGRADPRAQAGAASGIPGGLGGLLGGGTRGGGKNALMLMLLPIAMQWVQRHGGIGALLQRFQEAGQAPKVQSWVGTGENQPVGPEAVREVVGQEELSRLSRQLDVGEEEVAGGLAEIFPEMVNQLTPAGEVPQDADERLASGSGWLQQWLRQESATR